MYIKYISLTKNSSNLNNKYIVKNQKKNNNDNKKITFYNHLYYNKSFLIKKFKKTLVNFSSLKKKKTKIFFLKKNLLKIEKKYKYFNFFKKIGKKKNQKRFKTRSQLDIRMFLTKNFNNKKKQKQEFKLKIYKKKKIHKKIFCYVKFYNKYLSRFAFMTKKKRRVQVWNFLFFFKKRNKNYINCIKFFNFRAQNNFFNKLYSDKKTFYKKKIIRFKTLEETLNKFEFLKLILVNFCFKKDLKSLHLFFLYRNFLSRAFKNNKIKYKIYKYKLFSLKKRASFYNAKGQIYKFLKTKKTLINSKFKIPKSNFLKKFKLLKKKNLKINSKLGINKKKNIIKKKFKKKNIKKKKNFKKIHLLFWLFFKEKKVTKYKLKTFFKKYLIFFRFHKNLVISKKKKKKKKFVKVSLFKNHFWFFESKLNIFLVRIGFVKNLNQSNFLIKKDGISINNKLINDFNKKILINDSIQLAFYLFFYFKSFIKEKNKLVFFYILKNIKKNKSPFYLEINEKIQTCFLLYKPSPKKFSLKKIQKFSFFFYKFLFLFLKKKTF